MQGEGHDTPDDKIIFFFDASNGIKIILGNQLHNTATLIQTLNGKFVVQQSQHDVVVLGRHATVYHQGIALVDADPRHRVALNPKEIRRVFVANEFLIEVHPLLGVIGCR